MTENSLSRRYALGLVKSLEDEQEYDQVKGRLESFKLIMDGDSDFKAGMETQLFSKKQKMELLETVNKKLKLDQKSLNFLRTMIEENRLMLLDLVLVLLEDLWFEKLGIEKLKVISAVALNEKLEKKLIANLEKAFQKKVKIEKSVDESLIAGIKIQKGSIYYDFSIQGNLKKLKDAIISETARVETRAKEH